MLKSIINNTVYTYKIIRKYLIFCIIPILLSLQYSCGGSNIRRLGKTIDKNLKSDGLSHHHMGFMVYDPVSKDTLIGRAADRYFIPASNVKIFTLYSALSLIPNKVPALKYSMAGDTIYFEGQADPAALHPYFKDSTAVKFLAAYDYIKYIPSNMSITAFAPGWAWEDYDRSFASERSSFPLYGNVVSVYPNKSVEVSPAYFKDSVVFRNMAFRRKDVHNNFYVPTDTSDSIAIPMHMSPALTSDLLNELLNGNITTAEQMPVLDKKTIWGISRDSILKRMMVESDNFLAEQLLLAASATLSDTLESKTAISHMMERMAADLNPSPKWVDGSGLSRYNLFTPGSMVNVLNRLYLEFGKDYIFNFFPKGGVSGTLKEDFNGDPNPYIIAKSGSLGNVYCLSGYLITTSGRLLIFSYMNNHFTIERQQLKEEMALMFKFIRDNY